MKQYAKLKDNGQPFFCPRNGYVQGIAISNLNTYFNIHPDKAKEEGYYPINFLEEPTDLQTKLVIIDEEIYEILDEEENSNAL